jgi:hypothetical protein
VAISFFHPLAGRTTMITCRYCGLAKVDVRFEICRVVNGKVYRRKKCQQCKQETQTRRRARIRAWVEEFKKTRQCERCGYSDHRALDFHHREGEDKDFNVSDMVRLGLSRASIRREIDKCEVLCANCHRIEHYLEPETQEVAS